MSGWIVKQDLIICCLQEMHFTDKDKHKLRVKGWKKIFQANGHWNQAEVALLLSDKTNFKPKLVRRDKEGHLSLKKGSIHHQEEETIINIYAPKVGTSNFWTYMHRQTPAQ
jgi:hypothetical protein